MQFSFFSKSDISDTAAILDIHDAMVYKSLSHFQVCIQPKISPNPFLIRISGFGRLPSSVDQDTRGHQTTVVGTKLIRSSDDLALCY